MEPQKVSWDYEGSAAPQGFYTGDFEKATFDCRILSSRLSQDGKVVFSGAFRKTWGPVCS